MGLIWDIQGDQDPFDVVFQPGWERINTNIPESIGVGSQYWGMSIGVGGVLNKRIDQV